MNPRVLDHLKGLDPGAIDILLLHESPMNVQKSSMAFQLAQQVLAEIERLQPKLVLSGHTNIFSDAISKQNVRYINLEDMSRRYGIITVEHHRTIFDRKKAVYC